MDDEVHTNGNRGNNVDDAWDVGATHDAGGDNEIDCDELSKVESLDMKYLESCPFVQDYHESQSLGPMSQLLALVNFAASSKQW